MRTQQGRTCRQALFTHVAPIRGRQKRLLNSMSGVWRQWTSWQASACESSCAGCMANAVKSKPFLDMRGLASCPYRGSWPAGYNAEYGCTQETARSGRSRIGGCSAFAKDAEGLQQQCWACSYVASMHAAMLGQGKVCQHAFLMAVISQSLKPQPSSLKHCPSSGSGMCFDAGAATSARHTWHRIWNLAETGQICTNGRKGILVMVAVCAILC